MAFKGSRVRFPSAPLNYGSQMKKPLENSIFNKKPLLSKRSAKLESFRCLYCYDAPCIKACPAEINVPKFIKQISSEDLDGAAKTIFASNIMGHSCSRVCPTDELCSGACVLNLKDEKAIDIGSLQYYATSHAIENKKSKHFFSEIKSHNVKKIAIIGGGPAGITAASLLKLNGHDPTIFEKRKELGGLNSVGIASYKLKKKNSIKEISWLSGIGFQIETETRVLSKSQAENFSGKLALVEDILRDYDAILIAIGAGFDSVVEVDGLDHECVIGALSLIEKIKTDPAFSLKNIKNAHIIGGGNTAIDAANHLKLLGVKNVTVCYRKNESKMSCYSHELKEARKIGVNVLLEAVPVQISRDSFGSFFINFKFPSRNSFRLKLKSFSTDMVVFAIGQNLSPNNLAKRFPGVKLDDKGRISVDSLTGKTNNNKVWAAGDCVSGGKEVVNAVRDAKIVVEDMLKYFKKSECFYE